MIKKELVEILENVDDDSEIILVVYTEDGCETGYVDRVDANCKYNSVTGERLEDDESVVELTTSTGVN